MRQGHFKNQQIEQVIWGKPAAEAVAEEVARQGAKRVFVVASGSVSRKTDEVSKIKAALGGRFAGLFDEPKEFSPIEAVLACAHGARDCDPDLIVTIGGGTPIDTVKMVQLCLTHGAFTREALLAMPRTTQQSSRVRQIIVPTTLSGGEYSSGTAAVNENTGVKERFIGNDIGAHTVIYDPAVTVHTPEWLWLSTAIRALDHCAEGYLATRNNPILQLSSLEGLRLFARSLRKTKNNPEDLDARLDSQIAVWHSTIGLSGVRTGASHGIAYVLGGAYHVPHGYTSCVMLASALRWNASVNGEKQKAIAAALGEPNLSAGDAVEKLLIDLGLPKRLADVGIKRENFEDIATRAVNEPQVQANPRPITSPKDVMEILEMAA